MARSTVPITVRASSALSASGQSGTLDLSTFLEAVALLNVTAVSGTSPTLDVKFQTSDDGSDWYDLGSSFTQATGITKPAALKLTNFGRYVRAVYTLGGSASPSVTFTLKLVAKS
jgi:hypothetical protein